jgi:hypothetical protein
VPLRNNASNALEAMPRYDEVNAVAIEMLDMLQTHGLDISAIFFDGALPASKRDERIRRLEGYMGKMQKYRANHPVPIRNGSCTHFEDLHARCGIKVFGMDVPTPAKLKMLPALPFLVPSVIEAIQASRYGRVTAVVPGEADVYCATYACSHGAMIITSDSDLLVYDLGPNGSVALLRDIEKDSIENDAPLRVVKYETSIITKHLDLTSMKPFAYSVNQDEHRTMAQHLRHAFEVENAPPLDYQKFAAAYAVDYYLLDQLESARSSMSPTVSLDPRMSEWWHGLDSSNTSSQHQRDGLLSRMYLPVLIEDATRASPWDCSMVIRVLAYSMLRPSKALRSTTTEVMRRGNRIAEMRLDHFDQSMLKPAFLSYRQLIDLVFSPVATGTEIPDSMQWPFAAVHQLCHQMIQENKALPSRIMLKALLLRQRLSDWEYVHWSAQMQGIAYSFRMLHQCLELLVWLDLPTAEEIRQFCNHTLRMRSSIAIWADEVPTPGDHVLDQVVNKLFESLGIDQAPYLPAAESKASRKRSKRRMKAETESQNGSKTITVSSNMFSMLTTAQ